MEVGCILRFTLKLFKETSYSSQTGVVKFVVQWVSGCFLVTQHSAWPKSRSWVTCIILLYCVIAIFFWKSNYFMAFSISNLLYKSWQPVWRAAVLAITISNKATHCCIGWNASLFTADKSVFNDCLLWKYFAISTNSLYK